MKEILNINLFKLIKKIFTFFKILIKPSILDYNSTINFLKFRFKIDRKKIKKYKNIHSNSTIFLVAPGPSLEKENLDLLDNQIVIAYNYAYQILLNYKFKYFYSVVGGARINPGKDIDRKYFNASFRFPGAKEDELILSEAIKDSDVILPVNYKFYLYKIKDGNCGFSKDLTKCLMHAGGSSGFLSSIQLAVYMGAKKIVLLGADFDVFDKNKFHHKSLVFEKTTHWDKELKNWYDEKKPEIFQSIRQIRDICLELNIELINASSETSEKILSKKKLKDCI